MRILVTLLTITWTGIWFTPDQAGERLFERGEFTRAAELFRDPMRQGVAWYRAGEFTQAADAFARVRSPEASYNLGNAWVMLGKYNDAVASYDAALASRPRWRHAIENRDLALARAERVKQEGGDLGDQKLGADKVVFDKNNKPGGEETEIAGQTTVTDRSVQAIWLRNVQSSPADFLKAKFEYQAASSDGGASE